MTPVVANTYYFLGLVNRRDKAHQKCVAFSQSSDRPVVTTTWVLLELGDALRRGHNRAVFLALLEDIANDPDTTVIPAEQTLFERALELYHARPDKEWSLTDRTSFVVMQEQGLTDALTSDRHFEQAGFAALVSVSSR
jgi:predicted nucleic acid-binding protein